MKEIVLRYVCFYVGTLLDVGNPMKEPRPSPLWKGGLLFYIASEGRCGVLLAFSHHPILVDLYVTCNGFQNGGGGGDNSTTLCVCLCVPMCA